MSTPYLSVIIPAYNEADRIGRTLLSINDYVKTQPYWYEIVVVDDGSSDDTSRVVDGLHLPHVRVLQSDANHGKGFAVKRGMLEATGQFRIMVDADNATPFKQVADLLQQTDHYPVIIGSRYLPESIIHLKQPLARIIGSRILNIIVRLLLLPGFFDTQCGFKLFSSEAAAAIFPKQTIFDWGFDIEVLVLAKKLGFKVKQVPVSWYDQKGSKLHSPLDFLSTIWDVLKIKWMFTFHN